MVKIYGALRSRATRPVWVLEETGTPYEVIPVIQAYRLADPSAPDAPFNTATPDFLAINPQGQIPALVDGDLVMTESLAISWYLARKYGGDLAPRTLEEEGVTLQWGFLAASAIEGPALNIGMTYMKGQQASEEGRATIATAIAALSRSFARVEAALSGQDYLLADRFSLADILLSECVRYAAPEPGVFDAYPNLKAWIARCQARPAFQKMWADRNAEAA